MAYRSADRGLSEQELAELYDELEGWGDHPTYTMIDWRNAVIDDETRLGYWAWVASMIEQEENDGDTPVAEGAVQMAVVNQNVNPATVEGMSFSDDIEPALDGSLPLFDEVHYVYFAPEMEHGEAEGDYYSVVFLKDGKGLFSGLVPSGDLEALLGATLANKMVLGQGEVVRRPDVVGEVNPYRSLQVHGKGFTLKDTKWLKSMGISVPRS
jgi:hypothetical protein